MPRYVMLIDADKCLNCRACVVACQQRNAVPQGFSRNWVRRGETPSLASGTGFQPGACMHCAKPLCVDACPTRATFRDAQGVVQIDKQRCIGCGACAAACPYGARYLDPIRAVADKCDYCASSRAAGLEPACVSICATGVRLFGDADDPGSEAAQALRTRKIIYAASTATPTEPTLGYLGTSLPVDWPKAAAVPAPVAVMGVIATGTRWLGGLTLFGLAAVFLKNLVSPPYSSNDSDSGKGRKEDRPC